MNYNIVTYTNNYNNNNDFNNKNLMKGNVANAKGTAEALSFKIPITKNIELMIISFYSLSHGNGANRFSPY